MSKKKPDYTKFMRKPAPLRMSPPAENDRRGPTRGPVREEDIPWAEIIEECVPPVPELSKLLRPPTTVEDEPRPATSGRGSFFVPLAQLASPLTRSALSMARLAAALTKSGWRMARSCHALTESAPWRSTPVPSSGTPPLPAFFVVLVLIFLMIYIGASS
jgi:hypothetical protein